MELNLERVRANVRAASTEDLMDRATVYREDMEPDALGLIDAELRARSVRAADLADHDARRRAGALLDREGRVVSCQRCRRPAVARVWTWHRLWGKVPVLPLRLALCAEHRDK